MYAWRPVLFLRITAASAIGVLIAWDNAAAHAPGHSVAAVLIEILTDYGRPDHRGG